MHLIVCTFCLCVLLIQPVFGRDLPRPARMIDTLKLMKTEVAALPSTSRVRIDRKNNAILYTVDGQTQTLFTENLHQLLQQEPDGAQRARIVDDFLTSTLETEAGTDLSRILPVIRSSNFKVPGAKMVRRAFVPGLSIYLVEDSNTAIKFLTQTHIDQTGKSTDVLYAQAMRNLKTNLPTPKLLELGPDINGIQLDGYYESSLLLNTAFWKKQGLSELIAVVPSRDIVVFGDNSRPDMNRRALLSDYARDGVRNFPYPISDQVLVFRSGKWQVLR